MSLLVPRHIAREVQAERTAPPASKSLRDLSFSDEQVQKVIEEWDLEPVGQRIFVAPIVRDTTSGGIVVPDTTADMSWDGVVIATGPLAMVHAHAVRSSDLRVEKDQTLYQALEKATQRLLKPGDKVHFVRWSGERVHRWHIDCPPLWVMNGDDVIAYVKEKKK